MKFEIEGINFKIKDGKYIIDSVHNKEGKTIKYEQIKYDKEGNVIEPKEKNDDTTDAEKETDQD